MPDATPVPTTSQPQPAADRKRDAGDAARRGWKDLADGLARFELWNALAWRDTRMRYRGSLIGPWWQTISLGVTVAALGLLYGQLLEMELAFYLPYLALGLIIWNLLSSLVVQGAHVFINAEGVIKQMRLPFSIHVFQMIWRNLIGAAHNLPIFVVVALIFGVAPTWTALLALPGLALLVVNSVWVALLLGLLGTRFRDVPPVVGSMVQVVFFITPIIWTPERLGRYQHLAHLNPFYAFVDLLRAPLLGMAPDPLSWWVALVLTVAGWAVTFVMFARFRSRIPYWI